MNTSAFFFLTIGASLVTLLGLSALPPRLGGLVARWLYFVVGFLGFAAVIVTALRSAHVLPPSAIPPILFQVLLYRAWIPLGLALASIIWLLAARRVGSSRAEKGALGAFTSSPLLTQSLRLSTALSFVGVEIGKLAHDAEMRQFFVDSGFPFWMNYVVIVAELLGTIGLFVARLRFIAGLGLTCLMLGAIATHTRNGDPFSDSLEALQLLILLACLLALWRWGSQRLPRAEA